MRYSAARRKLLILDCCHAGMVFSDSRFKSEAGTKMASVIAEVDESEAFVALMASDRLERAREVEDLQGSFLTSEFCSALGERFQEADHDDDGAIDLKDLTKWLAARATKYNAAHPTSKVPKPFVFGRERGQLYLTLDPSAWLTHEITTEAGYVFCVLPLRASASSVQLIGKTLVTNAQYRAFVAATGYGDPSGKQFVKGKWIGPFEPWRDANFSAEDLPVVCVNFSDAERFCDWANRDDDARSIHLVPTAVWDFAAFGRMRPSYDRRLWRDEFMQHPTKTPRSVAAHDASVNRFGILDLFGNVWQWTDSGGRGHADVVLAADKHWKSRNQGLRGGSFLDDSERMSPVLIAGALAKGVRTRHSDLGFRMAAVIDLDDLPDDVARRVSEGPILEERDYPLSNVPPFASDMPS
jgi:hypothetical protein